jgi:hypothetical protein
MVTARRHHVHVTLTWLQVVVTISDANRYCLLFKRIHVQRLRWSRGSLLTFGTPKFAGSHQAEAVGFFGRKNPQHAYLRSCRSFTACKRSLNVTCKSAFRQHSRTFLAQRSTFRRWVLSRGGTRRDAWWRKLERLTQIAQ